MIKIKIPNNNINERKYIIDILFGEFLGLEYNIETGSRNYEIILENGSKLIIEDHFFNKFPNNLEYLKEENIPKTIEFSKNSFIVEDDIPTIYGINTLITNNRSTIICGIDVFASSFFMLTRWEEYINNNRDSHNRFPAYESLAYKQGFLDRPIVNEYAEMLKRMLLSLGVGQEFKNRNYQLVLTHDVDNILLFRTYKDLIRKVGGDLLKRKNPIMATRTILDYIRIRLGVKNDPYDTFDWLMEMSEEVDTKSYFFFMAKGKTKYDNRYKSNSGFVKNLAKKIKIRGHYIGIHPTYDAYNNAVQLKKEKEETEKNLDTKIVFGREHYLRFEVPTTWQIWEDNGMEWDSTCGYADKEGFRCGVCYPYSVFNILSRKKLLLKEKPLIVMEGNFVIYQDFASQEMENKILSLINTVKKYNGEFVLLWHNSNFNISFWKKYEYIYKKILIENILRDKE
jgi:hypothetical protein